MGKKSMWMWSAVVAGVCSVGTWAMSDDKAAAPAAGSEPAAKPADGGGNMGMDPAAMQAWAKAMTPGEQHKGFEAMAGKFTYKMWFKMDPSQPAQEATGEYEGEMILGGRYLTTQVHGAMMGEQFEGMGCLGYDNTIGKYVSAWIDNMGTGLMRCEGTGDGKTITFEGEMVDPMTNKPCKVKYVYTVTSSDEFSMKWWQPAPNGEMFESMGISYTRVK